LVATKQTSQVYGFATKIVPNIRIEMIECFDGKVSTADAKCGE
jgi:hypothetical protein